MMLAKLRAALEILLVMSEVMIGVILCIAESLRRLSGNRNPLFQKTILLFPEKNNPNILSNA
jgi:hypothetical protein